MDTAEIALTLAAAVAVNFADKITAFTTVLWVSITNTALILVMVGVGFYLPLLAAYSHSIYYLSSNMHFIRVNNSLTAIMNILY
jgi:hypothetical protein